MKTPIAVIIASAIIGPSIIGAGLEDYYLKDRYELSTTVSSDTALGWRLDRRSGIVTVCELAKNRSISADPPGNDPFADLHLPPVKGSRNRPVDDMTVDCGYE
jgi:hypothetical protein